VSTVPFTYYLHDLSTTDERMAEIAESAGIQIDDTLAQKIGRPFYEVAVDCTLDTDTGAVTINGART
jgi:hypothetical protein